MESTHSVKRPEEESLEYHRQLSRQIESLLQRSVQTLIDVGKAYAENDKKAGSKPRPAPETDKEVKPSSSSEVPFCFPPWLSKEQPPASGEKYLLTQALCSATLQKIWLQRRRFGWLQTDKNRWRNLDELQGPITEIFHPINKDFQAYRDRLHSENFGPLNPYTGSQVFRALLYAGESAAHRGIGFWAFFSVMGSLLRKFPEGRVRGAALEPWGPTAYITAKCLFPIERLCNVCERRSRLFSRICEQMESLKKLAYEDSHSAHWRFASKLDELSMSFSDMSIVSVNKGAVDQCAQDIHTLAGGLKNSADSHDPWQKVVGYICDVLQQLGTSNQDLYSEAAIVVGQIESEICSRLKTKEGRQELQDLKLHFHPPSDSEDSKKYWDDHMEASTLALSLCQLGLKNLQDAARIADKTFPPDSVAQCKEALQLLRELGKANLDFAEKVRNSVRNCATWCRSVVERELAHASAKNYTDFDPAELVSGIVAAVHWGQITSQLEISDAIEKALAGARADGSWSAGQPFYTSGRILAGYASTSDIVWELSSAIIQHPAINVADETLARYVAWLERTMCKVFWNKGKHSKESWGWASERLREPNTIDLRATALAINALLEIRGLVEYRLWQLCQKRFSVVTVSKSLSDIQPVDLGAKHGKRLHRRLLKMARDAEIDNDGKAEYSFILHGPPGSSKTVMAQALSKEMWRSLRNPAGQRLIRITPADFTRHGEDRIDSEARFIFDLLRGVRGVTVFFDEVDDLLRKRKADEEPSFIKLIVPAMLNRLADLREACPQQQICFLIGTNFIDKIEPALIRPGRIDAAIPVVYPDVASRRLVVEQRFEKAKIDPARKDKLAKRIVSETAFWPWTTLDRFSKEAAAAGTPAEINALLEHYSQTSKPDYLARLNSAPECSELVRELVHYVFAKTNRMGKLKLADFSANTGNKKLFNKFQNIIQKAAAFEWTDGGRG